ncbi:MAG: hypothetical protein V7647_2996 [Acidobacteriota bacterium]|jgi:hypothetical protein
MKPNRTVLTAVVIVLLVITGWWLFRRGGRAQSTDLVAIFASAEKRPNAEAFQVIDADLNGDKKKAIFTTPASRLIYRMRVPDDGWLKVALGMKPESWDKEGDGVLFRVGVSDGRTYDELFNQHLDPFSNKGDRRWIPVTVDLSMYAGEQVELIFNTNRSLPGKGDDGRNDLALWGAPEVVIR